MAQQQAIHKFVLGNKELEGKTAEFQYDRGWYSITDIVGEERETVYRSRNAQEAYMKWNVYIGRKKERPLQEERPRSDSDNGRRSHEAPGSREERRGRDFQGDRESRRSRDFQGSREERPDMRSSRNFRGGKTNRSDRSGQEPRENREGRRDRRRTRSDRSKRDREQAE